MTSVAEPLSTTAQMGRRMSEESEAEPSDLTPRDEAGENMHIHKPKAAHNVREFLSEIAVIVCGIVIALLGEQVVEAWHWHEKVAVVRETMMGELANDRARWENDTTVAQCTLRDIKRFETWAQEGTTSAPPEVSTFRGTEEFLSMHSANWTLAVSSQTLDHFPIRQQLAFAALYAALQNRNLDIEMSFPLDQRIKTLIPLAVDAQGRRDLRESLGAFRGHLVQLLTNIDYMKQHFDEVGVKADRADLLKYENPTGCSS